MVLMMCRGEDFGEAYLRRSDFFLNMLMQSTVVVHKRDYPAAQIRPEEESRETVMPISRANAEEFLIPEKNGGSSNNAL